MAGNTREIPDTVDHVRVLLKFPGLLVPVFMPPYFQQLSLGEFSALLACFKRLSLGYWGHSEQALRELEVPRNLHPSLTPQPLAKDS